MIAEPMFPVGSPKAFACMQDVVAGVRSRATLLLQAAVSAYGYDGSAAAIHDCGVTKPSVESTVAGHGVDLFDGA